MTQHRLGQHYSENKELLEPYLDYLKNINKTIVDPFVGEGHLLTNYLSLFPFEKQKELLLTKKIYGFDLFENNIIYLKKTFKEKYNLEDSLLNEIFLQKDSLLDNNVPNNSFILTNPPYLAKNVCKQKYKFDFEKYFIRFRDNNDYFEIALNQYKHLEGIWIVPANLISSENMLKTRNTLINRIKDLYIYEKKMFEDTDISVCSFVLLNNKEKELNIVFKGNKIKHLKINPNDFCKEWNNIKKIKNKKIKHGLMSLQDGEEKIKLIDYDYKEQEFYTTKEGKERLENNILILRTTDTGTINGKIGLYTIKELWNSNSIGLLTKISSRVYTQIFVDLDKEKQLILKEKFNYELNELREKYNSIFLTNFKNSSNGEQRKRISFKDAFSLMTKILEELK